MTLSYFFADDGGDGKKEVYRVFQSSGGEDDTDNSPGDGESYNKGLVHMMVRGCTLCHVDLNSLPSAILPLN